MKLTSEERNILISIVLAVCVGLLINIFFSYNKKIQINDSISMPLLVNINTATAEELDKLPGVGKTIAERIVTLRQERGEYKTINDLKKVKGITAKKLQKLQKYIITDTSK
ncbi:MAG: helix-hairpin-helix domain-containing protein [bacterium]